MAGEFDISNPSQTSVLDYQTLLRESQELSKSGRTRDALKKLEEAETNVLKLDPVAEVDLEFELGRICNNKGITLKNMKAWDESAVCYHNAIEHLTKSRKETIRERIGVEMNLAVLHTHRRDRKKALECFDRAEKLSATLKGRDFEETMTKINMNRVQHHLVFNEIDKARELLDRIADISRSREGRKERKARVSAQLGQLLACLADNAEGSFAKEYSRQAVKQFEEAGSEYSDLGMWRDAFIQMLNHAEALIFVGCYDDATGTLERVLSESKERQEHSFYSSAVFMLLDIAIHKGNQNLVNCWFDESLKASDNLLESARINFLEKLESQLRLGGMDELAQKIKYHRLSGGSSSGQ